LVTVILETCAAAAISAIVTLSKPRSRNSRVAWSEMFSLVWRFFSALNPMACVLMPPPYMELAKVCA
jgi:hypothetical protein